MIYERSLLQYPFGGLAPGPSDIFGRVIQIRGIYRLICKENYTSSLF